MPPLPPPPPPKSEFNFNTSTLASASSNFKRDSKLLDNAYFACSARAITPDTSGVEALVPVKSSVHLLFRVVVV